MRVLLVLLRKDCANFSRDRVAVALTFLVPIALIKIFGWVFGLTRKDEPGPRGIGLAIVNQSDNPGAQRLIDALKADKAFRVITTRTLPDKTQVPLAEADLRPRMRNNEFRFAVVLPPDLVRRDALGVHVLILSNPRNEIETQMVNGLLQKTIFSSVPELLGQSLQAQGRRVIGEERLARFNQTLARTIADAFGGDADEILRNLESGDFGLSQLRTGGGTANQSGSSTGLASALGNIVKIDTEPVVGQNLKNPEATRVVGGWAMMFLLFALNGTASNYFDEKKTGIFQRLLASPVTRTQLLWSRFIFGVLLGLVQLTTLLLAGRVMYDIEVFGNFGNLVVICIAAAAACTAFGMLIAAITPTAAAASGLATFLIMIMSACGGAWFPISLMPAFMQTVGKFTLVYWAMEGFSQVLWAGNSFVQILPTVGVLLAIATGVMAIAVWRFKRGNLFG